VGILFKAFAFLIALKHTLVFTKLPSIGKTNKMQNIQTSAKSHPQFFSSTYLPSLRTHLNKPQRHSRQEKAPIQASSSENDDLDRQLAEDLERLRVRQQQQQQSSSSTSSNNNDTPRTISSSNRFSIINTNSNARQDSSQEDGNNGVKEAIDKFLIADFFFILFALAWLGVGLVERSAFNSSYLVDTWLSLWQWLWQPAIGVLMLGALVSGGAGWVKENMGGK
jgi:hypothetical protein